MAAPARTPGPRDGPREERRCLECGALAPAGGLCPTCRDHATIDEEEPCEQEW